MLFALNSFIHKLPTIYETEVCISNKKELGMKAVNPIQAAAGFFHN
jgi:hypothetical protein